MGFRHVALLRLDADCDVEALLHALRSLPAAIPELRSYVVGSDLGLVDGNAGVVVVADFDDESGWRTYTNHPAHVAVIEAQITPHLLGRVAAQHLT